MKQNHPTLNENLSEKIQSLTDADKTIIETRFGAITVNLDNAVYFPSGLLGMPDKLYFCLADFPNKENTDFKILQSLNDIDLSFAVLPLPSSNDLIDENDINNICEIIDTTPENIGIVLISSTHNTPEGTQVSVNVRAPIVINMIEQAAVQYVFPNNKYKIRHIVSAKSNV